MFTDQELFQRLHAEEMDDAELMSIVTSHFHGAASFSPNEVVFPNTTNQSDIALYFSFKRGMLVAIRGGPALKEEDIAALERVILLELAPAQLRVGNQVLFASLPVTGAFRHRDIFQILPVPSDAPRPSSLVADHPFLLQFKYKASSAAFVGGSRRAVQVQRLQLLLSALLEGHVRSPGSAAKFHWVIAPVNLGEPLSPCSIYCQEIYTCPALERLVSSDSFFDITKVDPLQEIDPVKYYTRVGIQSGQSLSVPANLHDLLERFLSACDDDQERFIRACFWFNHAHTVFLYSRSASFTALISALEALMPAQQKLGDCPVCKRPLAKGATRTLNEFLDEYAPTEPKFQASRVALYWQFRSQLSHGGELSHFDRGAFHWTLGGKPHEEQELHDEVWRLVRIILVNWLHSRSSLLIPTKGRGRGIFGFGS
jgi:hypothetical protein